MSATKINFETQDEIHVSTIDNNDPEVGVDLKQVVIHIVEYPPWKNIVMLLMKHNVEQKWFWYMFSSENKLNFSLWSGTGFETREDAINYLITNDAVVNPEFYAVDTVWNFQKLLSDFRKDKE